MKRFFGKFKKKEDVSGGEESKPASWHAETADEKKKRHMSRLSLAWRLFVAILLFSTFLLCIVWIFQIGLLYRFYRQTKYDEIDSTDAALSACIENASLIDRHDGGELTETALEYAKQYSQSIRILRVDWAHDRGVARDVLNIEMSGDNLLSRLGSSYINYLYEKAGANGGQYRHILSSDKEAEAAWTVKSLTKEDDDRPFGFFRPLGETNKVVQARILSDADGNEYLMILTCDLLPLNATVETLKTQFWLIALITAFVALIVAAALSAYIARPIKRLNDAARSLAEGNYNADFSAGGYSEITELSDTLAYASEQLSQNDRLQKELIANISHDLRTPLTMIAGYGEMMRDIPGENTPENVQVIIDETNRLSGLVNDLLDFSRLQSGTRPLTLEPIDLTELLGDVMGRYEKLTQKDGYTIEYDLTDSCTVEADRSMLLQVIYNLINNAINYAGEDKLVRVTLKKKDDQTVRLSVIDHGVGIPPEDIPLIWDRYYKVDKVHKQATVGTGLGLSIVKTILDKHGMAYGVDSLVGCGSCFWFDMRVMPETEA